MNKINSIIVSMTLIVIILVICIILLSIGIRSRQTKEIDIEPEFLYSILKVGNYTGESIISPTSYYKDGLKCNHKVIILRKDKNIEYINSVKAYNPKNNQLEYTAERKGVFFYQTNHGNKLFKKSTSYINDKIVSNLYGYAVKKKNNSISFKMKGSRYVHKNIFHHIISTIEKNDSNKLKHICNHYNTWGLPSFSISESYDQI